MKSIANSVKTITLATVTYGGVKYAPGADIVLSKSDYEYLEPRGKVKSVPAQVSEPKREVPQATPAPAIAPAAKPQTVEVAAQESEKVKPKEVVQSQPGAGIPAAAVVAEDKPIARRFQTNAVRVVAEGKQK